MASLARLRGLRSVASATYRCPGMMAEYATDAAPVSLPGRGRGNTGPRREGRPDAPGAAAGAGRGRSTSPRPAREDGQQGANKGRGQGTNNQQYGRRPRSQSTRPTSRPSSATPAVVEPEAGLVGEQRGTPSRKDWGGAARRSGGAAAGRGRGAKQGAPGPGARRDGAGGSSGDGSGASASRGGGAGQRRGGRRGAYARGTGEEDDEADLDFFGGGSGAYATAPLPDRSVQVDEELALKALRQVFSKSDDPSHRALAGSLTARDLPSIVRPGSLGLLKYAVSDVDLARLEAGRMPAPEAEAALQRAAGALLPSREESLRELARRLDIDLDPNLRVSGLFAGAQGAGAAEFSGPAPTFDAAAVLRGHRDVLVEALGLTEEQFDALAAEAAADFATTVAPAADKPRDGAQAADELLQLVDEAVPASHAHREAIEAKARVLAGNAYWPVEEKRVLVKSLIKALA